MMLLSLRRKLRQSVFIRVNNVYEPLDVMSEGSFFRRITMIELKNAKTKQTIKVSTDVQTKPFIRAGYEIVKDDTKKPEISEDKK